MGQRLIDHGTTELFYNYGWVCTGRIAQLLVLMPSLTNQHKTHTGASAQWDRWPWVLLIGDLAVSR